jgi:hypothetical protein
VRGRKKGRERRSERGRERERGKGEGRRGSTFFCLSFLHQTFLWVPLGPKEDSFEQIIIF